MTTAQALLGAADLLPTPLLLVATDSTVAAMNRALRLQLPNGGGDLTGTPLAALLDPSSDPASYLRAWWRSGDWSAGALTFVGERGRPLVFRAEGCRFVPATGGSPYVLVRLIARDAGVDTFTRLNRHIADLTREIHRRKRLEAERLELLARERTAREQAELANRLKDEFLAVLSHELRTPLNAIGGWVRILRQQRLTGAQADHALEVIDRNTRLQGQLVEDLLDVSRIVTGRLHLELTPIDLAPVVEAAVDAVRPSAASRHLEIDVRVEHAFVSGDAARLQQVVWNLLTNAVKFTPERGRISVTLRAAGDQAEIAVADTGQGIDPAFLPHVFDRFRQADATRTRTHGGLGLGLALVQGLTEAHGGSVHAASAGPGQGAEFVVSLPLATAGAAAAVAQPVAANLAGLHALVVDDDADARELMVLAMQSFGGAAIPAASVDEAMPLLERERPGVLLADLGMPGRDGYELIRRLRALPSDLARIPAVAVTAYASTVERDEALRAGYDAHVAKPYEPAALLGAIAAARQAAKRRDPV